MKIMLQLAEKRCKIYFDKTNYGKVHCTPLFMVRTILFSACLFLSNEKCKFGDRSNCVKNSK